MVYRVGGEVNRAPRSPKKIRRYFRAALRFHSHDRCDFCSYVQRILWPTKVQHPLTYLARLKRRYLSTALEIWHNQREHV